MTDSGRKIPVASLASQRWQSARTFATRYLLPGFFGLLRTRRSMHTPRGPASAVKTMGSAIPPLTIKACDLAVRQRTRLMGVLSREYFAMMQREYATVRTHLPYGLELLLDIGAGLAGMHVHTVRDRGDTVHIHLLDRDSVDETMRYGYRERTEAYNSFELSRAYLTQAGVRGDRLTYWNADIPDDIGALSAMIGKFDAIISLKSWCFHYPAHVYLALVDRLLAPHGVLIVDVRRDQGIEGKMGTLFRSVEIVAEDQRCRRIVFTRGSSSA